MTPPPWFAAVCRLLPRAEREEIRLDLLEWHKDRASRQPRWRADAWLLTHTLRTAVRLHADSHSWTGWSGDVRSAFRQYWLAPGFVVTVVSALAMGIGATTGVFSLVNAAFFAPLPVTAPDRLVVLGERAGTRTVSVSYPNFLDWHARARAVSSMAAYQSDTATLRHGSSAHRLKTYRVSQDWLTTLGVAPVLGRGFSAADHALGAPRSVLLSHRTWSQLFGSDAAVLGTVIVLDDEPYVVVGVMGPGFDFFRDGEAWMPLEPFADVDLMDRRSRAGTAVIARLQPHLTIEHARTELAGIAKQLAAEFPQANTNVTATAEDLRATLVGPAGSSLWLLLGAVLGLLAVGCLNAANLLSARLASRRQEFALRAALGAGASRIARMLLVEGLVLAFISGAVGTLVAWVMVTAASQLAPPGIPGLASAAIDVRVLTFALGLSTIVGLIFGLVPLAQARSLSVQSTLADSTRTSTGSRRWRRVRAALVVGQVALSLTLVSGSTIMTQSLIRLLNTDIGFDTDSVAAVSIQLNTPGTPEEGRARVRLFYEELIGRLEQKPGVEAAAVANPVPLFGGGRQQTYWIEGQPYSGPSDLIRGIDTASVSPRYFETMGIALVKGRTFQTADNGPVPVVLVDETFVARYWPDQEPIGKRLGPPPGGAAPQATVIGVVGPVRQADVAEAARPQVYRHQAQSPLGGTLLVRASGDPMALAEMIRAEVAALDAGAPVWSIRRLDDIVATSMALARFSTVVLSAFAVVGLALAGLGIYGLMAYDVTQRRREIGVRMALGATAAAVRRAVLRRAMGLVLAGSVLGLAGAIGGARALSATFANLTTTDPFTYMVSMAVVATAGFAGCLVPSVRASRVDPVNVLR